VVPIAAAAAAELVKTSKKDKKRKAAGDDTASPALATPATTVKKHYFYYFYFFCKTIRADLFCRRASRWCSTRALCSSRFAFSAAAWSSVLRRAKNDHAFSFFLFFLF
jgi:hypothetical protein